MKAIVGLHLRLPSILARFVGACEIVGALMLSLGVAVQLAAILLGIFLLGVTLTFLQFWKIPDGDARFGAENAFFGNFGLLRGLIYVASFGPSSIAFSNGRGRRGVPYRVCAAESDRCLTTASRSSGFQSVRLS